MKGLLSQQEAALEPYGQMLGSGTTSAASRSLESLIVNDTVEDVSDGVELTAALFNHTHQTVWE